MSEGVRYGELGAFLRSRREGVAIDPATVSGRRRRTPGLRREEIADLAGISAVWYARIEQGREVSASSEALARIAAALRLGRAERRHLFELAGRRDPELPAAISGDAVPEGLAAAVAASAVPAYALDGAWNAVASNVPARALFEAWLGDGREANLLRYVFLDPGARRFIVDWELRATRIVAEFRADAARHPGGEIAALIGELAERSADFRAIWSRQGVMEREGGLRLFDHPGRGRIAFRQTSFLLAEEPDFKLVLLGPDDPRPGIV